MIELMIDLQGGAKAPLYEKIYEYIRREIFCGSIREGEKLPSTRMLAKNLAVSRSTVEIAYDQLLAEGYIRAEPCRGFYVCDITELYQFGGEKPVKKPLVDQTVLRSAGEFVDFSPYEVDTKHFPYNLWRKTIKNVLLDDREELLLSGDKQGEPELRRAIAAYLHQARGVNCSASQIIIGAGNEYLEILLAQLLGQGKRILMDDPGYPQAYQTFRNMGYQVETVRTAREGMTVEAVAGAGPDLVYMMPSHQFPIGSIMPLKQRLGLLKWASEREGRYLIEDDHDSEYRYRGKPIPSLQSIDRFGSVIYLGTFSKSIAPSLRISYLVLPPQLMERYRAVCGFYSTTVPRMQQEFLRVFIQEGHFERHLNKMRGIYRNRRDFLLGELRNRNWVKEINGEQAGLHLLVSVDTFMEEAELIRQARLKGIRISGIGQYYLKHAAESEHPVLLLGYGRLLEPEIQRGLAGLDHILRRK